MLCLLFVLMDYKCVFMRYLSFSVPLINIRPTCVSLTPHQLLDKVASTKTTTNEPRHEKTCFRDFWRSKTLTCMPNYMLASNGISYIETRCVILSKQLTIKLLIRLHGCAGWSALLLFTYGNNRFSNNPLDWSQSPVTKYFSHIPVW